MNPLRVQRILVGASRSSAPPTLEPRTAPCEERPARVTLTLPFEKRQKSRLVCTLNDGRAALLLLPRGHVIAGGTVLEADDGTLIEVESAAEHLSQVTAADPRLLMAIAYHLGNRHVALQVKEQELLYEPDHVLDDMVRGLGGSVRAVTAPFEPEAGAYHSIHSHAVPGHSHREESQEHG